MLTKLRIENFKAWKDTGEVRVAPLTVLFGANSVGKSSLGHLLLALKQTASSADRRRALHTGDESSLIDLGTFIETLHGHDKKAVLQFSLEWTIPGGIEVHNPLDRSQVYRGDRLELASTIAAGPNEQPLVRTVRYQLRAEDEVVLKATLSREGNRVQLSTAPYKLVHAVGRKWPLDPPEKVLSDFRALTRAVPKRRLPRQLRARGRADARVAQLFGLPTGAPTPYLWLGGEHAGDSRRQRRVRHRVHPCRRSVGPEAQPRKAKASAVVYALHRSMARRSRCHRQLHGPPHRTGSQGLRSEG